ncbi:MAG TPA: protealysin inhibitor emfourin [Candidatus Binatia bacterium]|nr:protealysin inhibitor emfourin [Candidatus Binatia bacterium]
MRIEFEMSGGYGGLFAKSPLTYRVDVEALPEALRDELVGLVRSSAILDEPIAPGTPSQARDLMTYRLRIADGERDVSVTLDDQSAPARIRPLLQRLQRLAIEARGQRST